MRITFPNPRPRPSNRVFPELQRLLEQGVLGNYEWFEIIEVSYCENDLHHNVFTLYVAIEGVPPKGHKDPSFINESRDVPGIKNRSFGIAKRYISKGAILGAAELFDSEGVWQAMSPTPLYSKLAACAPAFSAPDGTEVVPLNKVLKNNFLNGSYVIELADGKKDGLEFLTKDRGALNALSSLVRKSVPSLDIASVADRLGNVLIQIPVTSIATSFRGSRESNHITIEVAWHPDIPPRRLNGSIELYFDNSIVAYGQKELSVGVTPIVEDTTNRLFRGMVWDIEKGLALAAYPPTLFLGGGERPNGAWTERRISDTEIQTLIKQKKFIQYGIDVRDQSEHKRALDDIKKLVHDHGTEGVYLWDPYLSSEHLLATIATSPHLRSELRAITSSKPFTKAYESVNANSAASVDDEEKKVDMTKREEWVHSQAAQLDAGISERSHLNLEFRISVGPKGWPFHDRFLIFPRREEAPLVWSLGSSINQLGTEHAIVQLVAHPQPVLDAFESLWAAISSDEYLIWKRA